MANAFNCRQISQEEELQIINYYHDHALGPTANFFHISVGRVNKILEKYNVPKLSKEEIEKIRRQHTIDTCQALYNTTNGGGSDIAIKKIKATKLSKYGDENYNNINKNKQTCIEKYGVNNVFASDTIKDKIKVTLLTKYGIDHPSKSQDIIQKTKQTMLKAYGVDNYTKTLEFHKKARKMYYFNNMSFDSLPELAVYLYYYDTNVNIIRNPIRLSYTFNNKVHYYFPDFKINEKLIEIKGSHFFNEDGTMCNPYDHRQDALYEAKHQCGLANHVEFWTEPDYTFALDYFKTHYNIKDFIQNRKEL